MPLIDLLLNGKENMLPNTHFSLPSPSDLTAEGGGITLNSTLLFSKHHKQE